MIKNADARREVYEAAMTALKDGDMEQAAEKFFEHQEMAIGQVKEEMQMELDARQATADQNIIAARGGRVLTSEEREYYNAVISALSTSTPRMAIEGLDKTIPETILEDVFGNLKTQFPILEHVEFLYTKSDVKIIYNMTGYNKAVWGPLCADNTKELEGKLAEMEVGKHRLQAHIFVCRDMLTLGAEWLDRYVRSILTDALAYGLEDGIVNGDGLNQPVGMKRNMAGALDPLTGKPEKAAVALNSFSIEDLGGVMATMQKDSAGRYRHAGKFFFAYNPADEVKVLGARKVLSPMGYIDVVPFPIVFVPCISVEEGKAILGISGRYLVTAAGAKEGAIEYTDHLRFLQNDRTFKIELLANGVPKDNNSFALLDIANLKPFLPKIETVTETAGA